LRPPRAHRETGARAGRAGPLREGAAPQGLHAERGRARLPRRVLDDVGLPLRATRTAPRARWRRKVIMAAKWYETINVSIEVKKRYRRNRERVSELPDAYRTALEAVERYLMYAGIMKGDAMVDMFEDLLELFEQSVESATPVR